MPDQLTFPPNTAVVGKATTEGSTGIATQIAFPHTPFVTYDPNVTIYDVQHWGYASPLVYSSWKDEVRSWKETCYLHGGLNPTPTHRLTGPGAVAMLSRICVNNVERLKVGAATHAIMCAESGNIVAHGMLLRLGEQEYLTNWLDPVISYWASTGEYDVDIEDLTGRKFIFQLGGPRSLEVLEAAMGEDLHDLRFMRHRSATAGGAHLGVTGTAPTVLRMGMAGTLGYEVHGDIEDALTVYDALVRAGEPFGLRRLGSLSYFPLVHSENGFPQLYGHFQPAFAEDEGLARYLNDKGLKVVTEPGHHAIAGCHLAGSMGEDLSARYCNPVELGWGHMVKLDHEFIGRAALESLKDSPTARMVTLVWDPEDILDTYRSHFQPGEEYKLMVFPADDKYAPPRRTAHNDQVLRDGRLVGMSMGRAYSYQYRHMISICPIDIASAEPGTEVIVLWGDPGSRQKEIRATVAPFPLLDLPRNEHVDVENIPRPAPR